MAFLYQCENFIHTFAQEDPSVRQQVERKLENLQHKKRIIAGKTVKVYDRSGILILRIMGQGLNSRIIMYEHKINVEGQEHSIHFLREYISQGRYEPRWRNNVLPEIESGGYLKKFPLLEDELSAAEIAFKAYLNRDKKKLDPPPGNITNWFVEEPFGVNPEFSIYESQDWMAFSSDSLKNYSGDFFRLLQATYNDDDDSGLEKELVEETPERFLQIATYQDTVYLIYEEYQGRDNNKIMLLHNGGIIDQENQEEKDQKLQAAVNYDPLKGIQNGEYTLEDFSKGAVRAYPSKVLFGKRDEWINIQTHSNKSNLALSPEQLDLLKSYNFPKFINGQAGSGKSEMLYYLFAEILFRKKYFEFQGDIIFLTENEELLKKGLYDTRNKLRNNSQYQGMDLELEEIEHSFFPFRRFLRENLIDEAELYPENTFVNFAAFKRLYEKSEIPNHIKKKYPAEISWHIIYSYIKGQDAAKEAFTPEDFKALPRRDRKNIDDLVYEGVFDQVWTPFYSKLRGKGYWDQLDLVREILDSYESIPPSNKYTAILCDEAQDFTRVELQLLIRLSRFADYDLSNTAQVPITFAGDPFQTVNPTGFSLEKMKRLFNNELKQELQFTFTDDPIADLAYNYRSSKKIVGLANAIQYFRRDFLDTKDLRQPQEAKRIGHASTPSIFSMANERERLKEKLSTGIVFIVGCNDGEEEDFIEADNWLEEQFIVKSAARSKGSEYPLVALYKFGQQFVDEFGATLLKELYKDPNYFSTLPSGDQFKISFFFNKLYVAVTRAQEECYVLDSPEGITNFWQIIIDLSTVDIQDQDWQEAIKLDFLQFGNLQTLNEADPSNILRIADEDRENGLAFEDAEKMRDAAKAYQQLGKGYEHKVDYCKAKALQFNEKYKEAGKMLVDLTKKTEASTCYWVGEHWQELIDLHQGDKDRKSSTRVFIAKIMQGEFPEASTFLELGGSLLNAFEESDCKGKITWRKKFIENFIKVIQSWKESLEADDIRRVADKLESLDIDDPNYWVTLARLYGEAGQARKAATCWEQLDDYDNDEYNNIKLAIATDPGEKVIYLDKLGKTDEIGDLYQDFADYDYQKIEKEIILSALLSKNKIGAALEICLEDKDLWHKLYSNIYDKKQGIQRAVLLFEEMIPVIDHQTNYRHEFLTDDFFIKGAEFLPEKGPEGKGKKKSLPLSGNKWQQEAIAGYIKLMARSSLIPENLKASLLPFNLVNQYFKKATSKSSQPTMVEAVIAIERTHTKLVEALKFFDEYPDFLLRSRNVPEQEFEFLYRRWLKIQFKRALFDLKIGSGKIGDQKEEVQSLIRQMMENNVKELKNKLKLAHLPKFEPEEIERFPAFPDFYQVSSQLQEHLSKALDGNEMPAKTLPGDIDTPAPNTEDEVSNITLTPADSLGELPKEDEDPGGDSVIDKLISDVDIESSNNGSKGNGVPKATEDKKEGQIPEKGIEVADFQGKEENTVVEPELQEEWQKKILQLEKSIAEIQENQKRMEKWIKQLLESKEKERSPQDAKAESYKEENNDLWRELGKLQQKYIALLEKSEDD